MAGKYEGMSEAAKAKLRKGNILAEMLEHLGAKVIDVTDYSSKSKQKKYDKSRL